MDINLFNALKTRVQQGLQSFESAMDEMFGHVTAANARAQVLTPVAPTIAAPEAVITAVKDDGMGGPQTDPVAPSTAAPNAESMTIASGDIGAMPIDLVAGAFGDNPPEEPAKTDSV